MRSPLMSQRGLSGRRRAEHTVSSLLHHVLQFHLALFITFLSFYSLICHILSKLVTYISNVVMYIFHQCTIGARFVSKLHMEAKILHCVGGIPSAF